MTTTMSLVGDTNRTTSENRKVSSQIRESDTAQRTETNEKGGYLDVRA